MLIKAALAMMEGKRRYCARVKAVYLRQETEWAFEKLRASHLVVSIFVCFPSGAVVIYCHEPHVPSGCPAHTCCKEFPY